MDALAPTHHGVAVRHCSVTARLRSTLVVATACAAVVAAGLAAPAEAAALTGWVVTFAAPPTADDLGALDGVASGVHGFTTIPAAAVTAPTDAAGLLAAVPGVVGVYPDRTVSWLDATSVAAMNGTSVGPGTSLPYDGSGVSIGVIDAGVDGTHPDLCAAATYCKGTPVKTVQNVAVLGKQDTTGGDPLAYLTDQVSTDHSSGHGTHVAGIAAGYGVASQTPGIYRGVATGASLVGFGTGEVADIWNVLGAFDWAIAHRDQYGIKVLNNSWGPGYGTAYDAGDPVNLAIDAAWRSGITVVFGAGNDGPRTDALNAFSVNPHAISVAASDSSGQLAFFSSRGVPGSPFWHPTVAAPGNNVVSARALTGALTTAADATSGTTGTISPADTPYYAVASGTSMASPQVAGVVAVMQQAAHTARGVWLTPDQVKDILQSTARPALPTYQGYSMGAGVVDEAAAVRAAASGTWTPFNAGTASEVLGFSGSLGPSTVAGQTSSVTRTVAVGAGARSLDVMIDWANAGQLADLDVTSPSGVVTSTFLRCDPSQQPNGYSAYCSSQPNQRLSFANPQAGTWTLRVYGSVTATLAFTGITSVVYPAGTAVAAQAPASVTLSAAQPVGVVGKQVAVTATVRDAQGLPIPNAPLTWTSSGSGALSAAESPTRGAGGATAQAVSQIPGIQTVTVAAGGISASTTLQWAGVTLAGLLGPGASSPGRVAGAGSFPLPNGARGRIAVRASYRAGDTAPEGQWRYDDRAGTALAADGVEQLTVSGTTARAVGPCTLNGTAGYRCTLTVTQGGDTATGRDTAQLQVTQPANPLYGLQVGGVLDRGHLRVTAG